MLSASQALFYLVVLQSSISLCNHAVVIIFLCESFHCIACICALGNHIGIIIRAEGQLADTGGSVARSYFKLVPDRKVGYSLNPLSFTRLYVSVISTLTIMP